MSTAGQKRLTEVKQQLAAERVGSDPDVFEHACQHEIARKVERWLAQRNPIAVAPASCPSRCFPVAHSVA